MALALLVIALVLYFLVLEVGARRLLPRMSAGLHRIDADYAASRALRPIGVGGGARTILLVGNSLLLDGVVRAELRSGLAPGFAVQEFPIEGTTYLDWLFGLQRLFAEGARPAVVIVCLNFGQLTSDATHDAEFAYQLMQGRDLLKVKRAAGLDMMATSNYFFAHYSAWFGVRSHLRAGLLEKALPRTTQLAPYLAATSFSPQRVPEGLLGTAVQRLEQLQKLTDRYGARFVMLIPPSLSATDPAPQAAALAARRGISVLMPFLPAEMPPAVFSDGFHLDPRGAELFTARLTSVLPDLLCDSCEAAPAAAPGPHRSPTATDDPP